MNRRIKIFLRDLFQRLADDIDASLYPPQPAEPPKTETVKATEGKTTIRPVFPIVWHDDQ